MSNTRNVATETNSLIVCSFIDYLKVEKGLGALTVSAYTRDIGQFAAFLDPTKRTLLNARKEDVRGFIQQLFANSLDGRSVARKLSAIRHLYRYLLLDKRIERDPTLNIPLPKQWKVLPKSLALEEVEAEGDAIVQEIRLDERQRVAACILAVGDGRLRVQAAAEEVAFGNADLGQRTVGG